MICFPVCLFPLHVSYIVLMLATDDPTCHLAWDPDQPPLPLQLYHKEIYTGCLECTFRHLLFLYRSLGQVIRGMNSTLGVPFCDYASLVRSSQTCQGCMNLFSPDGYEQHRLEGRCTNHPDLSLSMFFIIFFLLEETFSLDSSRTLRHIQWSYSRAFFHEWRAASVPWRNPRHTHRRCSS